MNVPANKTYCTQTRPATRPLKLQDMLKLSCHRPVLGCGSSLVFYVLTVLLFAGCCDVPQAQAADGPPSEAVPGYHSDQQGTSTARERGGGMMGDWGGGCFGIGRGAQ